MTARIIARVDYYKPTVATGMACFHAGSMLEVCWKYAGSMLEVSLSFHCIATRLAIFIICVYKLMVKKNLQEASYLFSDQFVNGSLTCIFINLTKCVCQPFVSEYSYE